MQVDLLDCILLTEETIIIFKNGYKLLLKRGEYYTCAFGVVVDIINHGCIACDEARWKIGG